MGSTKKLILAGREWTFRMSRRIAVAWGYSNFRNFEVVVSTECHHEGNYLEICLHEFLHVLWPTEDEEKITNAARELAEALEEVEAV